VTAFPGEPRRASEPRVEPATRREMGFVNALICGAIGRGAGIGMTPRVFSTLARHRRLFRAWLRFAGRLMPGGKLPRRDTELVILRVSVLCGSDYEWGHHDRIGLRVGLTEEQIARVGDEQHDDVLLRAVDELVRDHVIGEETWSALAARYDERQLIELCLLTGHYVMLAGALNSLGVVPEK
jgi:alkylhydroperoxidase family enzyme